MRLVRSSTVRHVSANAIGWLAPEVEAWITSRAVTGETQISRPQRNNLGGALTGQNRIQVPGE